MCDTLCVLTDDGTLFAKSSDRYVGEAQVVEPFPARPAGATVRTQYLELPDAGAARLVGSRPTWLWGFEHGVNEHRLAIGNERVWTTRDAEAADEALIGMDLLRLALERATTAETGVEVITALLEEHGQGGVAEEGSGDAYFSSFLLADTADAWIVETIGRTWAAKQVDRAAGGAAISNRLVLGTDWDRGSTGLRPGTDVQQFVLRDLGTGQADVRLAATGAVACRPRSVATAPELAGLLRHHGGHPWGGPGDATPVDPLPPREIDLDGTGITVCMHLRGYEATAASMIAWLPREATRPMRAWAALGNPCVSIYVPCFPPAVVPEVLTDPATWARVASLRDAVEARTDDHGSEAGAELLARVRDALGPAEAELWAEADAVADAGPLALDGFAATTSARVRDALDRAAGMVGTPG